MSAVRVRIINSDKFTSLCSTLSYVQASCLPLRAFKFPSCKYWPILFYQRVSDFLI